MVKKSLVDIIIVNWNSGSLLEKCIRSIYNSADGLDFKLVIIDNNSVDESMKNIPCGNLELIIRSSSNLGFSKACNLGAKSSDSEYILFLNPDTVINSSAVKDSIEFLISTPGAGITGVRQESDAGELRPSCSRFLRILNLLNDISGLSKVFPKRFKPATIMTDWDHKNSSVVDQVMGSFMLLRRADFVRLNGFDEQFFVYFEDMDLAKRMSDIGKYSYYLSNVGIIHSGWGTSDLVKDRRLFYSLSGRIKYSRKHLGKLESFFITLLTFFPESLMRILYSIFCKHNFNDVLNILVAYKSLTKWLFRNQ